MSRGSPFVEDEKGDKGMDPFTSSSLRETVKWWFWLIGEVDRFRGTPCIIQNTFIYDVMLYITSYIIIA